MIGSVIEFFPYPTVLLDILFLFYLVAWVAEWDNLKQRYAKFSVALGLGVYAQQNGAGNAGG